MRLKCDSSPSRRLEFPSLHITNQKLSFDIFMVGNLLISSWNMILMIFGIKEKWIILTHCWILLQIYLCYLCVPYVRLNY